MQTRNLLELGDFTVWREPDKPAYQLAVVVDDAAMGVTEVVRGEDLLASTHRQILLYLALGLEPPAWLHLPLVVGPDGRRLAKRHGDTRIAALRAAATPPERVTGWLARACGWNETGEPLAPDELLPRFRLDTIPKSPIVVDGEAAEQLGVSLP